MRPELRVVLRSKAGTQSMSAPMRFHDVNMFTATTKYLRVLPQYLSNYWGKYQHFSSFHFHYPFRNNCNCKQLGDYKLTFGKLKKENITYLDSIL